MKQSYNIIASGVGIPMCQKQFVREIYLILICSIFKCNKKNYHVSQIPHNFVRKMLVNLQCDEFVDTCKNFAALLHISLAYM